MKPGGVKGPKSSQAAWRISGDGEDHFQGEGVKTVKISSFQQQH